mgnify:CR=1 FL=1
MLFLVNNAVFEIDSAALLPAREARRFERLGLDYVTDLGRELFSEDPLLHQTDPERARRLACLIAHKAPAVNAALFVAPTAGCGADAVLSRLTVLSEGFLRSLKDRAEQGELDVAAADRAVWGRLAA